MTALGKLMEGGIREDTPDVPESLRMQCEHFRAIARPWSTDMAYAKLLVIEHESYQRWIDETFPEFASLPAFGPHENVREVHRRGVKVGVNALVKVVTPPLVYEAPVVYMGPFPVVGKPRWRTNPSALIRYGRTVGWAHFTGSIAMPVLLGKDCRPWMSPTPSEVLSQRPGVRAARGRVLVGGLGMGWFAREVAKKKNVSRVTVVESDRAILDYFGARLRDDPKVELVHGDAYEVARGRLDARDVDAVLFDIWPSANDAAWCSDWQKFKADCKARGVRAWGWGDFARRD